MPSFGDSAFIFILALLLFGPKKLPELARQLGKLMGEFRRASNEFRMQMDEELRIADQAEQQKKIAAMEAAAPVTPALPTSEIDPPIGEVGPVSPQGAITEPGPPPEFRFPDSPSPEPVPIATAGDLALMPPDTGLPIARHAETPEAHTGNEALTPILETIPHAPDPATQPAATAHDEYHASLPDRHTNHAADSEAHSSETTEAPLHG